MDYLYKHLSADALADRIEQMDIFENEERLRLFTFFSANVLHFMPNSNPEEHIGAFKQVCLHQHLSWRDVDDRQNERPFVTGIDESFIDRLKNRPGIICTYHSGSYRLINKLLAEGGVPFALLVNKTVLQQEKDSFQNKFERAAPDFPRKLDLIDAEESTALIKMIRALRSGKNLLVYADGNTGSSGNKENNVFVDFMAGKLSVRKGLAVLSDLTRSPIYPVVCRRKALNEIHFEVLETILPSLTTQGNASYIQQTMQKLYRNLEGVLKKDPFQWECWLYLHQHIVLPKPVGNKGTVGMAELRDARLWGLFKIGEHCFVLNKQTYSSFKIPSSFYEVVIRSQTML